MKCNKNHKRHNPAQGHIRETKVNILEKTIKAAIIIVPFVNPVALEARVTDEDPSAPRMTWIPMKSTWQATMTLKTI